MNQKSIRLSPIPEGPQTPRFRLTYLDRSTIYLKNSQETQFIQTEQQVHITPEIVLQSSSNNVKQQVQQINPEYNLVKNTNIQLINLTQQTDHAKSKKIKANKYYESINAAFSLKHINFQNQLSNEQYQKITSSFEYLTNIELSRKKTVLKRKQAEEDCKIYKNGCWSKTKLMLTEDKLSFFQLSFQIKDLQKIKILPSNNSSINKPENIIKVVVKDKVHLFSLSLDKKAYQVPLSYFIFSKLIEKRIYQNEIQQWQKKQFNRQNCNIKDSYAYGNILKKSQNFGKWQKRFIIIKNNGIYSYKNSNQQQKFSFFICRQSIKYFWTRFEKLDNFLVIKIKHGIFKTEFGIPLTQYSIRSTSNWLYAFYRVLPIIATGKLSPIK